MKICRICMLKALLASLFYFSIILGGLLFLIQFKNTTEHEKLTDSNLCYGEVVALYNDPYDDREKCLSNVFPIVKFRPPYNNEIEDNEFIEVTKLSDNNCSRLKNEAIIMKTAERIFASEIYTNSELYDVHKWICAVRKEG